MPFGQHGAHRFAHERPGFQAVHEWGPGERDVVAAFPQSLDQHGDRRLLRGQPDFRESLPDSPHHRWQQVVRRGREEGQAEAADPNATKHALEALGEALSLELAPLGIRVVVVEPGMFRTQFSTSLQWTPENPAYHATSGELRQMVKSVVGQEPNDPAKGAAAILKVLESENPPLHFLLGEDAVDGLRQHHEALLAGVTTWETLSRSTTIS